MRAPLSWLRDFIDISDVPQSIAERLTMLGLEVEGVEEINGDAVFDISVTPNRPDCLSVTGIAREISLAYKKRFKSLKIKRFTLKKKEDFKVHIERKDLCGRYAGRIIRGVRIGDSPEWMKRRLDLSGIRSINSIVDITNYVMLESGQPLHAFDLRKLRGGMIRVDVAHNVESIVTLDSVKRKLREDTLLIWDGERPIAIAGVMGGIDSGVDEKTEDIFLESAYFDPVSVRRTSRALGLKTESSYRFERRVDIEGVMNALDRATELILEIAGGEITTTIDEYPGVYKTGTIKLRKERIHDITGCEFSEREIMNILRLLGFNFVKKGSTFHVRTLSRRPDIKEEIDLIEEIARVHGYENIPSVRPLAVIQSEPLNKRRDFIEKIKNGLIMKGFSEAINYSFMDIQELSLLRIPDGDERLNAVRIMNPLRKEEEYLRTNLTIPLIRNLITNLRHKNHEIKLFECGKVFFKRDNGLPEERTFVGGVIYMEDRPVLWRDNLHIYYILRDVVDSIINLMRVKVNYERTKERFLHPYQSADILHGDKKIGFLGIISHEVMMDFDLKTSTRVGIFEIDIDELFSLSRYDITVKPLPRFPSIERDLSIIIDEEIPLNRVVDIISDYPSDLIESVSLFDYYKGKNIPEGKKSAGIRIVYRSAERTLREEEVHILHSEIIKHLKSETSCEIRS